MNRLEFSGLHIDRLCVHHGEVAALRGVSMRIERGEHAVLIGPSGSGKTTLLRCVAGLIQPNEGEVRWSSAAWSAPAQGVWMPPERRRIGMIAQNPALWPHMTAMQHLLFTLRCRQVARDARREQAEAILEAVSLAHRGHHRPAELSGGEAQRLALARALVGGSQLLLLDEPLSQLDVLLRQELAGVIAETARRLGATVLHVTHDPTGTLDAADRIIALENGVIVQAGEIKAIMQRPATSFVAAALGVG